MATTFDLHEFERLAKAAKAAKTKADMAKGSYKAATDQLKAMGYDTPAEAKAALKKLDAKAAKLDRAYLDAKTKFEEEWDGQLGNP